MLALAYLAPAPAPASAGRDPNAAAAAAAETQARIAAAAAPAAYDPALVLRIGDAYRTHRFDFSHAFDGAPPDAPLTRAQRHILDFHFSPAVDDRIRAAIVSELANGDDSLAVTYQKRFANDEFLDQATQAIRVFGLHETDVADVTAALVIEGYNASHAVALTAVQGTGTGRAIRAAMLASPVLPALDDAAKQTIATQMSYQVLFWDFDKSIYGYGHDPANYARLGKSIAYSLSLLGIALDALEPAADGLRALPIHPMK